MKLPAREDRPFLVELLNHKSSDLTYTDIVYMTRLPLVIMDFSGEFTVKDGVPITDNPLGNYILDFPEDNPLDPDLFPMSEFLILTKNPGNKQADYYWLILDEDSNTIDVRSFFYENGTFLHHRALYLYYTETRKFLCTPVSWQGQPFFPDSDNVSSHLKELVTRVADDVNRVLWAFNAFLNYTVDNRLYPVKVSAGTVVSPRNEQYTKKSVQKIIKKSNGPAIRFLNVLPQSTPTASTGTGTPKSGHQRKAYTRTLRHERYRNHPAYGIEGGVKIRANWIGPKTSEYMGATYTVLEKVDKAG